MKKFIVVAGNIGVGKSSLVTRLCAHFGWVPFQEGVAENPYLADFYANMPAWGFQSQIFFLGNRLKSLRPLLDHPNSVVQDRSLYEDAEIFARNLHVQGTLNERDYATYRQLYTALVDLLPAPDLIVYLRASVETLQARITRRGRDYERGIPAEYLAQLNQLYDEWIDNFELCPVLTVPADALDFVTHPGHFTLIVQKLNEKRDVNGLIKALHYKDDTIRKAAAEALATIGDQSAVVPLITILENLNEAPALRRSAIRALAKLGDGRAVTPLTAALKSAPLRRRPAQRSSTLLPTEA